MKTKSGYIGLVGLLFLFLGVVVFTLEISNWASYAVPFALGAVCLIIYLVFNFRAILSAIFSRSSRYGAGSVISVVLVLGILIFIGLMANSHSARWDLTQNKLYSLSPQTIEVLSDLPDEIRVTAFFQKNSEKKGWTKDLFDQFSGVSDKFKYEFVDPFLSPARARAAGITQEDTVLLETAGRSEQIKNVNEAQLTSAIIRLKRIDKKRVYFLSGHGEKDPDVVEPNGLSFVKKTLNDQSYEVKKLLLMQVEDVPLDASVLVVAGPEKDPFENENKAIERYLRRGGRVLFMIDPNTVPDLANFLYRFNIKLGNDVIIDKLSRLYGADYSMPVVTQYNNHPITRNFNLASFFPMARSVNVVREYDDNSIDTAVLALTEDQAWGETDFEALGNGEAGFDEGVDQPGPIPMAAVGTVIIDKVDDKKGASKDDAKPAQGRFVVFGDSDFIANAYINLQGNGDLFFSTLNWLAEEKNLISIRPKENMADPLMMSPIQQRLIFWLPMVVMPLFVILVGVLVVLRRRGL